MKLTFNSEHRSTGKNNPATKGQKRYNYTVSGTKEELADFKKSQGQFYAEDDKGAPFINSPRDLGQSAPMIKRQSDGRWVAVVDEKLVAIQKLATLATKFPMFAPQFGAEASAIAVREDVQPTSVRANAPVATNADLSK